MIEKLDLSGQASIEFFIVIAAMFVVLAGVTHHQMIDPGREISRDTTKLAQAREASEKIAQAVNTVYSSTASGGGSVTSEPIDFSESWKLDMNPENVRVGVLVDEEWKWAVSELDYGIDNSISGISSGNYWVIAERTDENESSVIHDGEKIRIRIGPEGWS